MVRAASLLLLAGCQSIFGIGDTSLEPDASLDASPDAPPDAPAPKVNVGTGKDGPLVVATTAFTDDVRTTLAQPVGANSTLIAVASSGGFQPDDEVLVIQMTGAEAGRSDTRIVKTTTATSMTLDRGLSNTYDTSAANVVQVIRVPNFTDVTIPTGARLTAHAWDGATGGVVFFRASGTVRIASGGAIDAVGGFGGEAGEPAAATAGGLKGFGGPRVDCPLLGCGNALNGGWGSPGEFGPGPVGQAGGVVTQCRGGHGGRGGDAGAAVLAPEPGTLGGGPGGGAAASAGGGYQSTTSARPMMGGGGAGGDGAKGGRGAGGGGGGGGPIAGSGTNGQNGTDGEAGGAPGLSGDGGYGGGIVWLQANTIELDGVISVNGANGEAPTSGLDGGIGGTGGLGGNPFAGCAGGWLYGGQAGGGRGGGGGGGGNGGGGGAGGTILIESFTVNANGMLQGRGGTGTVATTGGLGGLGGEGFNGPAPDGAAGDPGIAGAAGQHGRIYIFYVDACTSCATAADPSATVMAR